MTRSACGVSYIEYSIWHLHPDWDVLTQTYEIRLMTDEGRFIYHSDFQLFPLGSSVPADFSCYPRKQRPNFGKPFSE